MIVAGRLAALFLRAGISVGFIKHNLNLELTPSASAIVLLPWQVRLIRGTPRQALSSLKEISMSLRHDAYGEEFHRFHGKLKLNKMKAATEKPY
jgi:hypothetical protein